MALSLITGGSGAGKTEYIYKKVIDWSMKEPQRQFFVIVPEQSTMQGQKDIVRLHPRRGTMNIDIVSFERLAYRIFGELSLPQPEILDHLKKNRERLERRLEKQNPEAARKLHEWERQMQEK